MRHDAAQAERAAIDAEVARIERAMAIVCCWTATATHVLGLFVDPYLGDRSQMPVLLAVRLGYLACTAAWLATRRWTRIGARPFAYAATLLFTIGFGLAVRVVVAAPPHVPEVIATTANTYMMFVIFGLLFTPTGRVGVLAMGAALLAATAVITAGGGFPWFCWASMVTVCIGMAVQYRISLGNLVERGARTAYRGRLALAPTALVREAAATGKSLDAAFQPRPRRCVCLSSDWRGFQALTHKVGHVDVAATLTSYYTMCDFLLAEAAPAGNYVCDWFADELFVVFFALDEATSERELAATALSFARSLLAAKADFLRRHGLPAGIDVGIAAGEAILGMMGPIGFRKATALGAVPARARALQTKGKGLRRELGDQDRIVCAPELAALLGESPRDELVIAA